MIGMDRRRMSVNFVLLTQLDDDDDDDEDIKKSDHWKLIYMTESIWFWE